MKSASQIIADEQGLQHNLLLELMFETITKCDDEENLLSLEWRKVFMETLNLMGPEMFPCFVPIPPAKEPLFWAGNDDAAHFMIDWLLICGAHLNIIPAIAMDETRAPPEMLQQVLEKKCKYFVEV